MLFIFLGHYEVDIALLMKTEQCRILFLFETIFKNQVTGFIINYGHSDHILRS